jgi:hypothetical protein
MQQFISWLKEWFSFSLSSFENIAGPEVCWVLVLSVTFIGCVAIIRIGTLCSPAGQALHFFSPNTISPLQVKIWPPQAEKWEISLCFCHFNTICFMCFNCS